MVDDTLPPEIQDVAAMAARVSAAAVEGQEQILVASSTLPDDPDVYVAPHDPETLLDVNGDPLPPE